MTNRVTPVQHTIDTPYPVGPVHCYTLEWDGELILIDTGPPTPQAKEYFRKHVDLTVLNHILVTHCHIDHYGLAHWLQAQTGAAVYLPYRDCLKISRNRERLEGMYDYLGAVGFDDSFIAELHGMMSSGSVFPELPEKYFVAEEHVKQRFGIDVHRCPGHSQSDLVYTSDDWAVTGDTLLDGIFQSPLLDIDLETGERFKNYQAYCTSLEQLAKLEGKMIFPGHREKVESVTTTLHFYITRLLHKVGQYATYKGEGNIQSIIVDLGLDSRPPFQVYLKASEIQFVLDLFEEPEKLKESLKKAGLFNEVRDTFLHVIGRTL